MNEIDLEARASRVTVEYMLREIQDLALQIRTDIAISTKPEVLLAETHRINSLVALINTQIRGYGREWL